MVKKQVCGKDLVPDIKKEREEAIKRDFRESIKAATKELAYCERDVKEVREKLQKLLDMTLEDYEKKYALRYDYFNRPTFERFH